MLRPPRSSQMHTNIHYYRQLCPLHAVKKMIVSRCCNSVYPLLLIQPPPAEGQIRQEKQSLAALCSRCSAGSSFLFLHNIQGSYVQGGSSFHPSAYTCIHTLQGYILHWPNSVKLKLLQLMLQHEYTPEGLQSEWLEWKVGLLDYGNKKQNVIAILFLVNIDTATI